MARNSRCREPVSANATVVIEVRAPFIVAKGATIFARVIQVALPRIQLYGENMAFGACSQSAPVSSVTLKVHLLGGLVSAKSTSRLAFERTGRANKIPVSEEKSLTS